MAPVQVPARAQLALQPGQGQKQEQEQILRPLGQSAGRAPLDRARCRRRWPGPWWRPKPA